jgi:membrane peptidoglycan carboxypeptidase
VAFSESHGAAFKICAAPVRLGSAPTMRPVVWILEAFVGDWRQVFRPTGWGNHPLMSTDAERPAAYQDDPDEYGVVVGRSRVEGPVHGPGPTQPGAHGQPQPKLRRRDRLIAILAAVLLLSGLGLAAGTYYVDSVPTPTELSLPESTTVYFNDGKTPMASLGAENRTLLAYDDIPPGARDAAVAAEDQTFWTNDGIDAKGVLRAAWNNVSGGSTQGASTITQQYARVAAELKGVTYSRKLREAVIAYKLAHTYSKQQILEFYLNTVPFGRGAFGIEAAAQAFFGKSANVHAPPAQQITLAEAMVLVAMIKQPEANPADPEGEPGYDPTRGPKALANSQDRWNYIRDGLVTTGKLTPADAQKLAYPNTVKPDDPSTRQSGLDKPTGIVVSHVLSELWQLPQFKDRGPDYIENGGFQIVTTIDKRAQDVAEAAADITRSTAPSAVRGQPANWQAGLVAVEPGTGRVLAYYGGNNGNGADYSGWYYDADGNTRGFGQHPTGSSFKVYDLAEALRQNIPLDSHWDSPPTKEFPQAGRTKSSAAGPVRNASTAACQPDCTLTQATVASLNVPFFDLTLHLGVGNVLTMAARAGVDSMWANVPGQATSVRVDLRGQSGPALAQKFSPEAGIGQYGMTVLDHANGMATFAADGKRADAHFVRSVSHNGDNIYAEKLTQTPIGLSQDQINDLDATLAQVTAGRFANNWDSAAKTGTWQFGTSTTQNAHAWTVGYTRALAAAVWVGTKDGGPLVTTSGSSNVFGADFAGAIWRQFMANASNALKFDPNKYRFGKPKPTPSPTPSPTPPPIQTPSPLPLPTVTIPPTTKRTGPPPPTTIGPTLIPTPPPPPAIPAP